jgi:transcriptional regulator with XRE-family HTH domain
MKSPLRQAREAKGQTIVEVCRAVGADPGNLSRIENGKQKASTELAEKLSKHFDGAITEIQIFYPELFPLVVAPPPTRRATDALPPEAPDRPRRQLRDGKNVMSVTDQPATFEKQRP